LATKAEVNTITLSLFLSIALLLTIPFLFLNLFHLFRRAFVFNSL
jgi:hypothetical protein